MAAISGIIAGATAIGSAIAAQAPAIAAVSTIASTGLGIAGAAGAFDPKMPKEPNPAGLEEPGARARRVAARERGRDVYSRSAGPLQTRVTVPTVLGPVERDLRA